MIFIKYIIKRLISLLLHILWIFPVRKNKIIFINDHSYTYSDNLKYLAEYFLEAEKDPDKYDIYFSLKNKTGLKDKRIKPVRFMSLSHFYHIMTSGTVFTNNSGIMYIPVRKSQLVINTWHGGGAYKTTGVGNIDTYWYRKDLMYNASKTDYILSDCRVFTEEEAKGLFYRRKQCINCGIPRLDILFDSKAAERARRKIVRLYGLAPDDKIVLYAPTFRGQFENYGGVISGEKLEIDHRRTVEALAERFGGNWRFAVRLHPRLKDVPFDCKDMINMTKYPDAEEILLAADVLITDYSSVMWDFSMLKRPCFIFAADLDDYEVRRGFFIPPGQWPYPLAKNNEELAKNISVFDQADYVSRVKEHHKAVGSYETGRARRVVKKIVDKHIERS